MGEGRKVIRDKAAIESMAKRIVNKTLRSMLGDTNEEENGKKTTRSAKGGFGYILEREYFGIEENFSESVPDFRDAGIELKSSPVVKGKYGLRAKERMVLNIINYNTLKDEEFSTSSFIKKNGKLLVVFYLHETDKPVLDLKVVLADLWSIPEADLPVIRKDWEDIREKVMAGKAQEIHEGMTRYLGACTKGKDSTSLRSQPFSDEMAMQRAFAFKQSYVNSIISSLRNKGTTSYEDSIIKAGQAHEHRSFEDVVMQRFEPYIGMEMGEIAEMLHFDIGTRSKNVNDLLTRKILGVKKRISEFEKADITMKSITIEANGKIREHISFPAFKYDELVKDEDWETSPVRDMFVKRFFFVIYQKDENGVKHLKKVMVWSLPSEDLEEVKKVWGLARRCVREGRYSDLPKGSENRVSHIRPHARDSDDTVIAPDGSRQVKRCFWLNRSYVAKQIDADTGS